MPEINKDLIKKALGLTGKTMEDMGERILESETHIPRWGDYENTRIDFSYHKFLIFLLSPKFIEDYTGNFFGEAHRTYNPYHFVHSFSEAIYEFQRKDEEYPNGNIEPLESLLKKI